MVSMTENDQPATVGQVARDFGITVRTLHHYDEIGLLVPGYRSHAGYRLYTTQDIERLQHIVVYRRLGFSLDQVATVLAEPHGVVEHLRRQRDSVIARRADLDGLIDTLTTALEAAMNGYRITQEEQRELFGDSFDDDYAQEAQQRWGQTDAWAQSTERTKGYDKTQWEQLKVEVDVVNRRFVDLLGIGASARSVEAMDTAEQARQHIVRWFYDCSPQMHAGIAELYVTDERFTRTYEDQAPGLAQFVHDAVVANADRQHG